MDTCPKCGYSENSKKEKLLDSVYLHPDEKTKLIEKFGETYTTQAIEKLNNYIMSHGKQRKYKSHYHTILSWSRNDNGDGNSIAEQKAEKFLDCLKDKGNKSLPELPKDMVEAFYRMGHRWAVLQESVLESPVKVKEQYMKAYMGQTIIDRKMKSAGDE